MTTGKSKEIAPQKKVEAKDAAMIEKVLIGGDLSKLDPGERLNYVNKVCVSLGLNPLTRPFQYISLGGKIVLYATKDATEQLRTIHGISLEITNRETIDDVFVVTAAAKRKDGRADASIGAVMIKGLAGEAKANAFMKAETKAKRRVTLSICGLGMLDESETDSIPNAQKIVDVGEPQSQLPQDEKKQKKTSGELLATLSDHISENKHDPEKLIGKWEQMFEKDEMDDQCYKDGLEILEKAYGGK